ncbi:MAG TPA: hypothetical protein VH370_08935, partial [Humisphaera sp.]|nr:hypothetical protein [Humisphaera sp.]
TDFAGKSLFVHFVRPGEETPWNEPLALKTIYDRYCDDPRVEMLTIMLDNSANSAQRYRSANGIEWEVAAGMLLPGVLEQFSAASTQPASTQSASTQPAAEIAGVPLIYLHTPTHLFLIGPDGRLLAKNLTARTAMDAMMLSPRDSSSAVRVEHHAPGKTSLDFKLTTIPSPQTSDDLSRGATFSLVDGQLAQSSGGLRVLNDGRLPSGADSPGDSVHFSFGSLEGRFKMDLSRVASIGQINTYSWHKSDRGPQVYKVYGSDGTAPGFNANPRIGVNPQTCGWTLIAGVDTRPTAGPVGGQYAVSIGDGIASLGSYRYLLFNTFVTETRDDWGHTFFNEIAVSSAK